MERTCNDDIYNSGRILNRILEGIKSSSLEPENKENILKFYSSCVVEGLGRLRTIKYLTTLRRLSGYFGKPFSKVSKEDIAGFIQEIESSNYSDWTKRDYKITLKKFFKWLKGGEEYPEEVKWIRARVKNRHLLPEELLTEEEVERIAEAAYHPRDKALIQVMYDSGCRIGELLSLRIKHVQFDGYGAVLMVNGKTGQRRVRIIASAPALAVWMNNHPLREETESWLWINLGARNRNSPLTYGGAKELVRRIAEDAEIKKRVYPHLFRHSRATKLANALTESQLKQHLGWVQSSQMASTYVHLSGRDVDSALLKLNGIVAEKEENEEQFKVRICSRCKTKNGPTAKFCDSCGLAMDIKSAIELDNSRRGITELLNKLMENPEKLSKLFALIES